MSEVDKARQQVQDLDMKAPPESPQNGIEEGNDSGVDESTQFKEGHEAAIPPRSAKPRSAPRRRQAKSTEPPVKRNVASSIERKLPMNRVEVGKTPSPNLTAVKSRVGSLNSSYKPGGGNVKIESKKLDFSSTSSRIAAKNDSYTPGGGNKKIENRKVQWSAQSKVGSLANATHRPGGGDKKIETQKLNFSNSAKSRVGSKDNVHHKAGGGDVKITDVKLNFSEAAASKVGSMANVKHRPGGGEKKIFDDKEYIRQMTPGVKTPSSLASSGRTSGAQSPAPVSPPPEQLSSRPLP